MWVDHEAASTGVCGAELQNGDEVLLYVDCFSACRKPCGCSQVPAKAAPGSDRRRAGPRVRHGLQRPPTPVATAVPAVGATVTVGGQQFTTGANGIAQRHVRGRDPSPCGRRRPITCRRRPSRRASTNGSRRRLCDSVAAARHDRADRLDPRHPRRPALHAPPRPARAERHGRPTTRRACGRSRSASPAGSTASAGTSPAAASSSSSAPAASSTRSRSATARSGATCCPRACRAAATCSAPTRSTTRSTTARRAGWCSASDEAAAGHRPRRRRRCPRRRPPREVDAHGRRQGARAARAHRGAAEGAHGEGRRPALPRRRGDAAVRARRHHAAARPARLRPLRQAAA